MSSAYSRSRSWIPLPYRVVNAVESTVTSVSGGVYSLAGHRSEKVGGVVPPIWQYMSNAQFGGRCFHLFILYVDPITFTIDLRTLCF